VWPLARGAHPEKKLGWSWAKGAPKNFGFPCNISATAEASNFKFGMWLGFARPTMKSHAEKKVGIALG